MTSVGTRTAQAAISPREEAIEWVKMMWVREAGAESGEGRRERLTPS
jgi:hypothetical protein